MSMTDSSTGERDSIHGGPFWNAIRQFNETFSESHTSVSFTYNNIIKIGKHEAKGLPSEPILRWQNRWFEVVREEVRVLAPDAVIFFTGPDYDKFIEEAFGSVEFCQIGPRSARQLTRVRARVLPVNTFRTYHPNYLWRNDFHAYKREIVSAIRA